MVKSLKTPRRPKGPMFRNRIVGHGEETPDQLLASPFNGWKIHPTEQQDEVEKVMETVGWVQRVIVNRRSGHVVDGHLRIQLALRRNEETVPVSYIDVSPEEERLLILTLDPLARLSARDAERLAELLEDTTAAFPETEIDFGTILKTDRKATKGLAHEVKECTCCQKRCKPGCGCYRESEQESHRYPKRRR